MPSKHVHTGVWLWPWVWPLTNKAQELWKGKGKVFLDLFGLEIRQSWLSVWDVLYFLASGKLRAQWDLDRHATCQYFSCTFSQNWELQRDFTKKTKTTSQNGAMLHKLQFLGRDPSDFLFCPRPVLPLVLLRGKRRPFPSSPCNVIWRHKVTQQNSVATHLKWRQHRGLNQSVREGSGLFFPFRWEHHWMYSLLRSPKQEPLAF